MASPRALKSLLDQVAAVLTPAGKAEFWSPGGVLGGFSLCGFRAGHSLLTESDSQWGILEAETMESEAWDSSGSSNAEVLHPSRAGGDIYFLKQGEPANELNSLLISVVPALTAMHPGRGVARRRQAISLRSGASREGSGADKERLDVHLSSRSIERGRERRKGNVDAEKESATCLLSGRREGGVLTSYTYTKVGNARPSPKGTW